jgi:hypothetical protein
MNFFRSMEIDPTCKFSPPQSRSGGISFYGFSAPRRFHATKTLTGLKISFEVQFTRMVVAGTCKIGLSHDRPNTCFRMDEVGC